MYKLRMIRWIDSTGLNGWQALETIQGLTPDPVISVGFVVAEDEDRIVITTSITERPGNLALQSGEGALVIPRVAIVSEREVYGEG